MYGKANIKSQKFSHKCIIIVIIIIIIIMILIIIIIIIIVIIIIPVRYGFLCADAR